MKVCERTEHIFYSHQIRPDEINWITKSTSTQFSYQYARCKKCGTLLIRLSWDEFKDEKWFHVSQDTILDNETNWVNRIEEET